MELKLITEQALGPGEAAAARAITVYSITHRMSFCTCILGLKAAIQLTVNPITIQAKLQEWATMLKWSNH